MLGPLLGLLVLLAGALGLLLWLSHLPQDRLPRTPYGDEDWPEPSRDREEPPDAA